MNKLTAVLMSGVAAVLLLTQCSGGGGGGSVAVIDPNAQAYTIGGTVSGLNGTVVLQNNGADDLTVAANKAFTFATAAADGTAYNVTVKSNPNNPNQTCTASSNAGTIAGANVTNVSVVCSTNAYTVGGSVSGLSGSGLVLQNNTGDDLAVSANGTFVFLTGIADAAGYAVTVKTQPTGPAQTCTVNSGGGTIVGADVTGVTILCSINTYAVGGTVSGLTGTLKLRNNTADDISLASNGTFTFATALVAGSTYSVSFRSIPVNQNCSLTNGAGTMTEANLTSVAVTCSDKSWIMTPKAVNLSPDGQNTFNPKIAMDNNDNAVVVWQQSDGAYSQIYKAERRGMWFTWSDPTANLSPDGTDAVNPVVATGDNGDAIVAWLQSNGANVHVFMSEYRRGLWTSPSTTAGGISPDGSDAANVQVAMDSAGNALIVWEQLDGTTACTGGVPCKRIFKSEYRNNAWTHPAGLMDGFSQAGRHAKDARVAMDDNGNTVVVWTQSDTTTGCGGGACNHIIMREYRGGGWYLPESPSLNTSGTGTGKSARDASVAMSNNGNAAVAWAQETTGVPGAGLFISERRGTIWTHPGAPTSSVPGTSGAQYTRTVMDSSGNTIVIWLQQDASTTYQVYKSEYRNGAWTHPANLTDSVSKLNYSIAVGHQVAMDDNGNAVLVWTQADGTGQTCMPLGFPITMVCTSDKYQQVYKAEYRNGSWTLPASATDNMSFNSADAFSPGIAMSNSGLAVIVQSQSDGANYQVYRSEFK